MMSVKAFLGKYWIVLLVVFTFFWAIYWNGLIVERYGKYLSGMDIWTTMDIELNGNLAGGMFADINDMMFREYFEKDILRISRIVPGIKLIGIQDWGETGCHKGAITIKATYYENAVLPEKILSFINLDYALSAKWYVSRLTGELNVCYGDEITTYRCIGGNTAMKIIHNTGNRTLMLPDDVQVLNGTDMRLVAVEWENIQGTANITEMPAGGFGVFRTPCVGICNFIVIFNGKTETFNAHC